MHYLFADCLLDTQLCTLYRAGQGVPLRPKAFHVLRYLLEHCNHLVSKDELCTQVWPAQFISDATIDGSIKCVRQAIGDTGRKQQLIQTRRGYGYRFVGAVEERREEPTAPLGLAPVAGENSAASSAGAVSPAPRSPLADRTAPEFPGHGVPGGERKLVTLLGCALAQAATVQAQAGLDALHGEMGALFNLSQEMVDRYGGVIHHVAGTRLLALFGAPLAQEDHARRAVLAAWGLHQRLAALRDTAEEPLAACLGLHTGLRVV
jgi:DNA-binding winged helix-turn-helix (wHTH) protein